MRPKRAAQIPFGLGTIRRFFHRRATVPFVRSIPLRFPLIVLDAVIVQPALDVGAREFWSEKTALLRITFFDRSGFFQQLMPDKEGSAQRAARVPRRRLNPDRFEGSLTQESSAGHTVQCHAAGEYQIAQFRLLMKAAGKSKNNFLRDSLDTLGRGDCRQRGDRTVDSSSSDRRSSRSNPCLSGMCRPALCRSGASE